MKPQCLYYLIPPPYVCAVKPKKGNKDILLATVLPNKTVHLNWLAELRLTLDYDTGVFPSYCVCMFYIQAFGRCCAAPVNSPRPAVN